MSEKLKPCPFFGGEEIEIKDGCSDVGCWATNKHLKEIEARAIDIQMKANLAVDHKTYDLMRTVLGE